MLSFLFPSTLNSGILQLLQSRTSRKFLACRLTPDMETKLLFMTSRVSASIPVGRGIADASWGFLLLLADLLPLEVECCFMGVSYLFG